MRLVDLNPQWVNRAKREGLGVSFKCPCGCGSLVYIPFSNPLDGGPTNRLYMDKWDRWGETFETLTLSPAVFTKTGCGWFGFVADGAIRTV